MAKKKHKQLTYEEQKEYALTRLPQDPIRREAVKNVINDISDGATWSVLTEKLKTDYYGLGKKYSDSNTMEIIKEARMYLRRDFENYVKEAKINIFTKAMDLFTECKEMGDRATALKCLQYVAKLTGVDTSREGPQVNILGLHKEGITINFGFEKNEEENNNNDIQEAEVIEEQ